MPVQTRRTTRNAANSAPIVAQTTAASYIEKLIPIIQASRPKRDGTLTTIQEYYRNITENEKIINRAARNGFDIRAIAMAPPINQPEQIIGVAVQPELDCSELERTLIQGSNNFGNYINNISSFIISTINRLSLGQIQSSNTIRRRSPNRRCRETRNILESNISSLYRINDNLLQFLNVEQILYLTRNNIIENYYYRRLELFYKVPFVDNFTRMANDILVNMGNGIRDTDYRYDIEYVTILQRYYASINGKIYRQNRRTTTYSRVSSGSGDLVILKHRKRTIELITKDIEKDVSREKIFLHNYKRNLKTLLDNPPVELDTDVRRNIIELKNRIELRICNLNTINISTLRDIFTKEEYENKRKNLILILKSLSLLCQTFMIIIQKIKFMVTPENAEVIMPAITDDMFKAINYYSTIIEYDINVYNIDTTRAINNIIMEQQTLFTNIRLELLEFIGIVESNIVEGENHMIFDFSIYYRDDDIIDSRNMGNIREENERPQHEVRIARYQERLNAARIRAIERYNRRIAARTAAREAVIAAREARSAERIAARAAAMAARTATRTAMAAASSRNNSIRIISIENVINQLNSSSSSNSSIEDVEPEFNINSSMVTDVDNDAFKNKIILGDINELFKTGNETIMKKLEKSYNKYNLDLKVDSDRNYKKDFYNQIRNKFKLLFNNDEPTIIIRENILNFVTYSIASLFARYIKNEKDMKFNDLNKYFVVNYSIIQNEDGSISVQRQQGIDAGGLRRDFITSLTTELFNSPNGILITREGTNKYFLNPNYKPDNIFKYIFNRINPNPYNYEDNFIKDFYGFIGQLLSFILVNDCGLEKQISSYLIAALKYRSQDFSPEDYLYFMYIDFPEYTNSLINLLRMHDPNDIQHLCIGFNDYYNLEADDTEVNADNIETFLYKTAEYMMTKTILRKDIDVYKPPENSRDPQNNIIRQNPVVPVAIYDEVVIKGTEIHDAFIKGIPLAIKRYFAVHDVPYLAISSYINKPKMTLEIVEKLKTNFNNTMNRQISQSRRSISNLELFKQLFNEYVFVIKPGNSPEEAETNYLNFIEKLLRFWSGSSIYKENEEYKIQINNNLSPEHFPQSHTCFFLIDIPLYNGGSREEIGNKLYQKLYYAINNIDEGFSLAGGSNKKNK